MVVKYSKPIYKWKKGDTLDGLAKKHKHRKGEDIWTSQDNLALRKKRKKPEQIQAGDVVVIPLRPKDAKAMGLEVANLQSIMAAETTVMKTIERQRKEFEAAISKVKQHAKEEIAATNRIVGLIQADIKTAKKIADGVDVAWTVFNVASSLTKIVVNSQKALGKTLKEVKKSQKRNVKELKDMTLGPMQNEVFKAAAKETLNIDKKYTRTIIALGTVAESFVKITSPSFWFWTAARMLRGEKWSKAVSTNFDKEAKEKIQELERLSKYHQKLFQSAISEKEAGLAHLNSMRNASYKEFRTAEKRLKELEKSL